MPAPAITVTATAVRTRRGVPTNTGRAGVIGISRTGPVRPLTSDDALRSHQEWLNGYGGETVANGRLAYSTDCDGVEEYFNDGGSELVYSRVVGPTPVFATLNIPGTSGTTLVATADEYGDLANTKKVAVINGPVNGATHRVVRLLENDGTTVIDETAEFNDRTAVNGVKLNAGGDVPVTLALGGGSGLPPVMAATVLAGGTDDHANITQAQIDAALARLGADLGPVNVAAPNWGTSVVGLALLAHGALYQRFVAIDTIDTATKATVLTQAGALQGNVNGQWGDLLHPWITIPPLAAGGTDRSVPGSWMQLAKWAETDALDGAGPNQAAAGDWGTSSYATGVRATYDRMPAGTSDADDLADAGVTLIANVNGDVQIYDTLTLIDPDGPLADVLQQAQTSRYLVWKIWQAKADAQLFAKTNRDNLAKWDVRITGRLLVDLANGDLFMDDGSQDPNSAFVVDTGGDATHGPNSEATLNAGQMNAVMSVRPVKGARFVNIAINLAAMTQPV